MTPVLPPLTPEVPPVTPVLPPVGPELAPPVTPVLPPALEPPFGAVGVPAEPPLGAVVPPPVPPPGAGGSLSELHAMAATTSPKLEIERNLVIVENLYLPTKVVTVLAPSSAVNAPLVTVTALLDARLSVADVTHGVSMAGAVPPETLTTKLAAASPLLIATSATVPSSSSFVGRHFDGRGDGSSDFHALVTRSNEATEIAERV